MYDQRFTATRPTRSSSQSAKFFPAMVFRRYVLPDNGLRTPKLEVLAVRFLPAPLAELGGGIVEFTSLC